MVYHFLADHPAHQGQGKFLLDNFYKEGSGNPTIDDGFTVVGRESKVVEHGFVSVLKTADSAVEFGLETGANFVKDTVTGAIKAVLNPFNYLH